MQSILVDLVNTVSTAATIRAAPRRVGDRTKNPICGQCSQSNAFQRSRLLRITLLITLGLCIVQVGCQNVATTWSAEARSPDGQWLVIARSQQWGGPGNAYDATTVYLKRSKGSQRPTQILVFSHQYATMNLKMEWISPNHLDVKYGPSLRPGDHVNLDFQISKIAGISVSVQDISGTTRY